MTSGAYLHSHALLAKTGLYAECPDGELLKIDVQVINVLRLANA